MIKKNKNLQNEFLSDEFLSAFKHPTTPDGWSDKFPKDMKPKPTPPVKAAQELKIDGEKLLNSLTKPLQISQATLGERIQALAGDPNRRGARPWWQSGWKSEGEAVEALQNNPELIQHFDNQPGFPKDLFKQ